MEVKIRLVYDKEDKGVVTQILFKCMKYVTTGTYFIDEDGKCNSTMWVLDKHLKKVVAILSAARSLGVDYEVWTDVDC